MEKPKRVSWLGWDYWELECKCGKVIKMRPGPKLRVTCKGCGIEWILVNGLSWILGAPPYQASSSLSAQVS